MNQTKQDVDFGGLRVKIGGNDGLFKYFNLGFKRENYRPDSFVEFLDIDETRISALSLVLQADSRDNPIYPLKGFWGAMSLDFAHDLLGGDRTFVKLTLDSRFYQRVSKRNVFALHLKAGYTEDSAPFYERFFLGGANSLRGYRDRRLTPTGWGTKLLLANAEFRFPISQKDFPYHKVSGVLFLDAGGSWLPGQDPKFDDLFSAAGLGFRVKVPVLGITRFDFSFPLNKVDNEDFQFHVSLGHTF